MTLAPLADVQLLVVDSCTILPAVELPLMAAAGHVLSAAVVAPEDIPPFANSAMDGFAVQAADTHREVDGGSPLRPFLHPLDRYG